MAICEGLFSCGFLHWQENEIVAPWRTPLPPLSFSAWLINLFIPSSSFIMSKVSTIIRQTKATGSGGGCYRSGAMVSSWRTHYSRGGQPWVVSFSTFFLHIPSLEPGELLSLLCPHSSNIYYKNIFKNLVPSKGQIWMEGTRYYFQSPPPIELWGYWAPVGVLGTTEF